MVNFFGITGFRDLVISGFRRDCPLYIGNIGIAIQVNAGFLIYEGFQKTRQFHAHRATDNQRVTKSYEKPVAFFVFVFLMFL